MLFTTFGHGLFVLPQGINLAGLPCWKGCRPWGPLGPKWPLELLGAPKVPLGAPRDPLGAQGAPWGPRAPRGDNLSNMAARLG